MVPEIWCSTVWPRVTYIRYTRKSNIPILRGKAIVITSNIPREAIVQLACAIVTTVVYGSKLLWCTCYCGVHVIVVYMLLWCTCYCGVHVIVVYMHVTAP